MRFLRTSTFASFLVAGGTLLLPLLSGAGPTGAGSLQAQEREFVPLSQLGSVSQTVNTTEISVHYSRPVARGRDLFGALLAWDEVWNPGANDATWIEFSRDVRVEGEALEAGRYSLWLIPREGEPWTVIFSREWDVFHAPYPEGADALRVEASPDRGQHMETLVFYFPVAGPDHTELRLHWGETYLPLRIEVERVLPVRNPG